MALIPRLVLCIFIVGLLTGRVVAGTSSNNDEPAVTEMNEQDQGQAAATPRAQKKSVFVSRPKQGRVKLIIGGQSEGGRAKQLTLPVER